jgi:hypothetical protein
MQADHRSVVRRDVGPVGCTAPLYAARANSIHSWYKTLHPVDSASPPQPWKMIQGVRKASWDPH